MASSSSRDATTSTSFDAPEPPRSMPSKTDFLGGHFLLYSAFFKVNTHVQSEPLWTCLLTSAISCKSGSRRGAFPPLAARSARPELPFLASVHGKRLPNDVTYFVGSVDEGDTPLKNERN